MQESWKKIPNKKPVTSTTNIGTLKQINVNLLSVTAITYCILIIHARHYGKHLTLLSSTSLQRLFEVETIIILILPTRKLRITQVK